MRFHKFIVHKGRHTGLKLLPIERKTAEGDGDQLDGGQELRRATLVWLLFCTPDYTRS